MGQLAKLVFTPQVQIYSPFPRAMLCFQSQDEVSSGQGLEFLECRTPHKGQEHLRAPSGVSLLLVLPLIPTESKNGPPL